MKSPLKRTDSSLFHIPSARAVWRTSNLGSQGLPCFDKSGARGLDGPKRKFLWLCLDNYQELADGRLFRIIFRRIVSAQHQKGNFIPSIH